MEQIKFRGDDLYVSSGYQLEARSWFKGFLAPLEQVAEVSLTSLRNCAVEMTGRYPSLRIGWADHPTLDFEAGEPSPELVWIESDGTKVLVGVSLSFYEPAEYPESDADFADFVAKLIDPILPSFPAVLDRVEVDRFDPTSIRGAEVWLEVSPRRRVLNEAAHFGEAVREQVEREGQQILRSVSGVIRVLGFGPGLLIGQPESVWLEAKRQLYDLEQKGQKIELAKDIAGFANADGGILLFGFSTSRKAGRDVISKVQSVSLKGLSRRRYLQVIRSRVFPMPRGIEVVPLAQGNYGLAYIHVPRQAEELKPFFMKDVLSKEGTKTAALAIPVRSGAHVEFDSPEAIHALIVAGRAALRVRPPEN